MNNFGRKIIKWTIIGLLIRLAIMPFTMHGQDLVFINYFPMMFVEKGIWDPYLFISDNFPHFTSTYYGPVLFVIMSAANFIFVKVLGAASLVEILDISSGMMFKGFSTIDYIRAFAHMDLFRNLFLMKTPYLLFDLLTGIILLKLVKEKRHSLTAYKLWMLNIVVLQSVYAVGGAYVITAFFIIAAVYAAYRESPYISLVMLALGGATKLIPYILILPTSLLLGRTWKKRFLLISAAGIATLLVYLPFYISSSKSILDFFLLSGNVQYTAYARYILTGTFTVLYGAVSVGAFKDSYKERPQRLLVYYMAITLFLSFMAFPVRFRYFVFLTPLLAMIIPGRRKFGAFVFALILMLAFQWLTARELQMGLFAPINTEYFLNLPTLQEIVGHFVDIEILYRIFARVLPLCFFTAALWLWRIKLQSEGGNEALC